MSVVESAPSNAFEPAWQIATLFPNQGHWSESDYLSLTQLTRHLVELVDGRVEVLPMPTGAHQNIVAFLLFTLRAFVTSRKLGWVIQSPFRVRIAPREFREPDISFLLREHKERRGNDYWEGADLVIEVVSDDPKDRARDLEEKRVAYARAKIPEYWIIDPQEQCVRVLKLARKGYVARVVAGGGKIHSSLLPGFELKVNTILAAADFED